MPTQYQQGTQVFDTPLPAPKGAIPISSGYGFVQLPADGDGTVLTCDSTKPLGLKWAAGGGGGLTPIPSANLLANPTGASANPVATPLTNGLGVIGGTSIGLTGIVTTTSQSTSFTAAWGGTEYTITGSGNVTVTIPTPVGNNGNTLAVACDPGYTGICTLTPTAGLIGGAASRIIWAGERVALKSDGTNANRIGGQLIPMAARLRLNVTTGVLTVNAATMLPFDTVSYDNTGALVAPMASAAGHTITIRRPGRYAVTTQTFFHGPVTTASVATETILYKNGSPLGIFVEPYIPSTAARPEISLTGADAFTFAASDVLAVFYNTDLASSNIEGSATLDVTAFSVTEIPGW